MKPEMKGALIGQGRTAEVFEWGQTQILKLYRQEVPPYLAELEARIGSVIMEAKLAAPRLEGLIELEGRTGLIYERVSGPSMLQLLSCQPWRCLNLAHQFAQLQAQIHAHSAEHHQLPLQTEMLKSSIERATPLITHTKEKVLAKLALLPEGKALCHGDFHPDNVVMSKRGPVVIDWLTATQGNPLADIARTSYLLTRAALPPGTRPVVKPILQIFRELFYFAYLGYYRALRPFSPSHLQEWRPIIAAARLSEQIHQEETRLLAMVEEIMLSSPNNLAGF